MKPNACPICKATSATINGEGPLNQEYALSCPRCGSYKISDIAWDQLNASQLSARQLANASGWLREHPGILINTPDLAALASVPTPSVVERGDKILRELARRSPQLGGSLNVRFEVSDDSALWMGVSWSIDLTEMGYLFAAYLKDGMSYIEAQTPHMAMGSFPDQYSRLTITPEGHAHLAELTARNVNSQIGFCAMWFDKRMTPLWTDAIRHAIHDAGYDPKRIDAHEHNNKIDDEIVAMIRRSKFIVADFTGNRGGVYFEAGFAMGLGLPIVWTCREGRLSRIHFDNRQYNFVTWNKNDLTDFRKRLHNRIEATLGRGTFVD